MTTRHHVFRAPGHDTAWVMKARGGFWGPYSRRPRPDFYFLGLTKALMDGAGFWDRMRVMPEGYPFSILGQPGAIKRNNEMLFHRQPMDFLVAGQRLESLIQRLQLLARERDCFRVLAELKVPEGTHAER